jgi:hypothetical protein
LSAIEQAETTSEPSEKPAIEPPHFHIGRVDPKSGELLKKTAGKLVSVPWRESDAPEDAFRKLVQAVWDYAEQSNPNPQLDRIFDYYLRMVWQLSLAIPLPYVDGHLFDIPRKRLGPIFELSNTLKTGAANGLQIGEKQTIRFAANMRDPVDSTAKFDVFVDNLKLLRPIKFVGLPTTSHAIKTPLVFVGKCDEKFKGVPRELSGGPLVFEAYLFWNPKIVPTEHQGSLVRIHGSSGTLFDPTFMRYQVSEQTRLRQITCEIFVSSGLDSALNIDRESFNNAHPHSVYLTKWLHNSLRQLATAQKRIASELREHSRDESREQALSEIQKVAITTWRQAHDDPAAEPPSIEFSSTGRKSAGAADGYVFSRSVVIPAQKATRTAKSQSRETILEEKLKAIAQVLASFGLLDTLSKRHQEQVLRAISEILFAAED